MLQRGEHVSIRHLDAADEAAFLRAVRSSRKRLGASTGGWFSEVGKFQSINSKAVSPHSPSDAREYA